MIGPLLLAALVAALPKPMHSAPADIPPLAANAAVATVLSRYTTALAKHPTPSVVSYQYVVEQTGARDLLQSHQIFRSGVDQRDEILSIDGRRLARPIVRVTHGRHNRYAVEALAPRPDAYVFHFLGRVRNARHDDFIFATTPRSSQAYHVTSVTIDGSSYLPSTIAFETLPHAGRGSITFVRADRYWVPALALARATYAKLAATERISFMLYRFPPALPPGTFTQPRPTPTVKPPSL